MMQRIAKVLSPLLYLSLSDGRACRVFMRSLFTRTLPKHNTDKSILKNPFRLSWIGKVNPQIGGHVYKNVHGACYKEDPSVPYEGQAAERISEAFGELLSVHVCHCKAYKTHLLVRT